MYVDKVRSKAMRGSTTKPNKMSYSEYALEANIQQVDDDFDDGDDCRRREKGSRRKLQEVSSKCSRISRVVVVVTKSI